MRILLVAAEIFPLLKTGGLADIVGALPPALTAAGEDVRVLLPAFPAIRAGVAEAQPVARLQAPWGEEAQLLFGRLPLDGGARRIAIYLIDAPGLYERPGNPYEDAQRQPYGDNHRRFALLGWAAMRLAQGLDAQWRPELVHAHDWHAGLAPAYLRFHTPQVRSLFTVHNLAYQGLFQPWNFPELGLPAEAFQVEGLEFHGQLSFMKAGLFYADRISTVSPGYAREIQTPAQGQGLDGLLRARSHVLHGILNAVDDAVWNPATDALLPRTYQQPDGRAMHGKALCKAALQAELGLHAEAQAPLFIVVSRLSEQKGLHLVLEGLDALLAQGGQLALLGSGEAWMQDAFRARAAAQPGRIAVRVGHDEALAHRLFGAGDVVLVPSRFEPCGLTQMYGLAYGALPLVHRVGGLADTVTDCTLENIADGSANGFVFETFDSDAFARAVRRAFALYARPIEWRRVRATGMRQPHAWAGAAAAYIALYRQALQAA
ncbi:glycogen synthase GlgA [Xenophilus sp. Marseille-Q4582]|uniref:glycogen synthase GlgA n=1 Tax=Xenophilus sp. Marseille-Q4582 TaxID=2866600 RepID=UPI001CE42ED1|nr:glycogen synthase GlgA [Xenophilus sp. Marseille-Q4582]